MPSIAMKIARGTVRAGSFTSPLGTSADSTPRNAKISTADARATSRVAGRRGPHEILAMHRGDADDEQHDERKQLRDGHRGVEPARAAHARDVERREAERESRRA